MSVRERTKTVFVYENGDFSRNIAMFTPDISSAQDNLINPTVKVDQNGESTFKFSMYIKSDKWKDIKHFENIYQVDGRRYTALNADAFEYVGDFVNVTLVETWYLLDKDFVQAHNTDPEREGIDEQSVVLLPKSTEKLIINGVAHNDNEVPYPRGSAGYNLWAILKDTNWKLDVCDVIVDGFSAEDDYGVFNVETDMKSVLENITNIQSLYGGILVWDSINNLVSLRDEDKWDSDYGFEIREGKNLKEKPTIRIDNDIYTVVYPLGDGNLNIKDVNGGKSYIENFSYTKGIYKKNIKNTDIYDQKQLKFWGNRQLEYLSKPRKEIVANMVDVSTTEEQNFEKFGLNDIASVYYIDPDTGEQSEDSQRIVSVEYNVYAPFDCSVSLGDAKMNIKELLKQVFDSSNLTDDTIGGDGTISSDNIHISSPGGGGYGGYQSLTDFRESITEFVKDTEDEFIHTYSAITQLSDEFGSFIKIQTGFNDTTTSTAAKVEVVSTELLSMVEILTEFNDGTADSSASVTTLSDAFKSFVEIQAEYNTTTTDSATSITTLSGKFESFVEIQAEYNTTTTDSAASITTLSGKFESFVETQAEYNTNTTKSLASIKITADDASASIELVAKRTDGIDNRGGLVKITDRTVLITTYQSGHYFYATQNSISLNGNVIIEGNNVAWKTENVLTSASVNTNAVYKTTINYIDQNGNNASRTVLTGVSSLLLQKSSTNISYLGKA